MENCVDEAPLGMACSECLKPEAGWRQVPVTMAFLADFMDAYCGADGYNLVVMLATNAAKQKL